MTRWTGGRALLALAFLTLMACVFEAAAREAAFREVFTSILCPETGEVAVRVTVPERPRYASGAPVLVEVPPFATPVVGFSEPLPVFLHGAVHVTLLWPGRHDPASGVESEGIDDYGGPNALAALRQVIRFAAGEVADVCGSKVDEVTGLPIATSNVGLYAFSHPGIPMTRVMVSHGQSLGAVSYLVGGENPTDDVLFSVEVGHWGSDGRPVYSPFYDFPEDYTGGGLVLDAESAAWEISPDAPAGRPVLVGSGGARHALGNQVPRFFGKRIYSVALLEKLVAGETLSDAAWPEDLATLSEARAWWPDRTAVGHYASLSSAAPQLHVMLVFGLRDHVQPAADKPHIHQAYEGFRAAGLWVRLNPDRAYLASLSSLLAVSDHPAGREPEDWREIESWAVGGGAQGRAIALLAGTLEMMDRAEANAWEDDLDRTLYPTRLP
ncbi:MAG: hypothetical protein AB1778_05410 [Candidatus Bipolaricaulota bacterium]